MLRLRQQATLETRPDKTYRSLAEMTDQWRQPTATILDGDPEAWVTTLADRNELPLLHAGDLADGILADAAHLAAETVAARRATFTRANIAAEGHRQLLEVRFATPPTGSPSPSGPPTWPSERRSWVTAPELHHTPERFRRPDGTGRFRPRDHIAYTTRSLLDAEARLLETSRDLTAPSVDPATVAATVRTCLPGRAHTLSADQATAVEQIATSGRSSTCSSGRPAPAPHRHPAHRRRRDRARPNAHRRSQCLCAVPACRLHACGRADLRP